MFNTLSYIGEKLNHEGVVWGVGASVLLHYHGLVEQPKDIDILVATNDIKKVDNLFKNIGIKSKPYKTTTYATEFFYEYIIKGFDVDVMAGLRIKCQDGVFSYGFDASSITDNIEINGITIPLTSLEDWYVIYQLIPNRQSKVMMIENHLLVHGIQNPTLLERLLRGYLPKEVREKIQWLMTCN
ncbi:nucleotidyltransferase family protein [Vallitalea pronyensis]|nr:hypothetical protein [Vallitalea pronyensis]